MLLKNYKLVVKNQIDEVNIYIRKKKINCKIKKDPPNHEKEKGPDRGEQENSQERSPQPARHRQHQDTHPELQRLEEVMSQLVAQRNSQRSQS